MHEPMINIKPKTKKENMNITNKHKRMKLKKGKWTTKKNVKTELETKPCKT